MPENPNIIQDLGIVVFNGKLIVRQATIETKFVVIPNKGSAEVQKCEGYVLAVADDVEKPINVGDYLAYGQYAALPLPEGKEDNLYMVDSGDILYKKNAPKKENTEDTK